MPSPRLAATMQPWARRGAPLTVTAYTANAPLSVTQSGSILTNDGATGSVELALPAGAPLGTTYTLMRVANQAITLRLPPGEIARTPPGSTSVAGTVGWAASAGSACITVTKARTGEWVGTATTTTPTLT